MSSDTNTNTPTPTDIAALERTVDAYVESWNETDPRARAALIEQSLGADLWYRDPLLEADGPAGYGAMIHAVQAQFPGLVMRRTSPLDAHRDLVRFNWALGEPGADPMFAGLDVAKTDADGRLHRIIGFSGETISAT